MGSCPRTAAAVSKVGTTSSPSILRPRAGWLVPGKLLVQRSVDTLSQSFDLILNQEFAALQFDDTQVVRGKVYKSLVQFSLQNLMFTFQFNEMRLNCHT